MENKYLLKHNFWETISDNSLLNLSPYKNIGSSVKTVLKFCNAFTNQIKKNKVFPARLKFLIKMLILYPAKREKERKALDYLLKMLNKEIKEISNLLMSIHLIQEKKCAEIIKICGEEGNKIDSPDLSLLYKLLLELSSNSPVWIGKINDLAPPKVGSVPEEECDLIKAGRYVVAFVIPESTCYAPDKIECDTVYTEFGIVGSWILARVLKIKGKHHKKKKKTQVERKYIIENIDPAFCAHYIVPRKAIVPLPLYRADPRINPEAIFPVGSVVLALYEKTWNFFPAVVISSPKSLKDTYTVRFRDISTKLYFGPLLSVPQRYVLKYKEPVEIYTKVEREILKAKIQSIYTIYW